MSDKRNKRSQPEREANARQIELIQIPQVLVGIRPLKSGNEWMVVR